MAFAFHSNVKAVVGDNVCATCPSNCCKECARNGGWFGERNSDFDKMNLSHLPVELVIFGNKMIKYFNFKECYFGETAEHLITENEFKIATSNFIQKNLPKLKEILGYNFEFTLEKGFLTDKGCSLERKHRSRTCTHFSCGILELAIKRNLTNKTYQEVENIKYERK